MLVQDLSKRMGPYGFEGIVHLSDCFKAMTDEYYFDARWVVYNEDEVEFEAAIFNYQNECLDTQVCYDYIPGHTDLKAWASTIFDQMLAWQLS